MTDFEKLRTLFPPTNRIIYRWKEYGDNQPVSKDKVFCCPVCGKGRLFEWQLTLFCPHCGIKLSKSEPQEKADFDWLKQKADEEEKCCSFCGGTLSEIRYHNGKPYRHCYGCHFDRNTEGGNYINVKKG